MDNHMLSSTHEEIRPSRRGSSLNSPTISTSTDFHHVGSNYQTSPISPTGKSTSTTRRSSSIGEDDLLRMRQLYSKLIFVISERAKLNPALKDPKRASFQTDESTENILKAESQFAPHINLDGDFTMVDAVNEEVDCALMDAIDNYGHGTFLPEDEEMLVIFLREVSNKMHGTNGKTFSRRRGTKMTSLIQVDVALLEGYTVMKGHFAASQQSKMENSFTLPSIPKHIPGPITESASIQKWSFDPFERTDAELMDAAFQMIKHFGLIEKYKINPDKLRALISTARKNYRPNAFHNFYHAFGVMHLSFLILNRGAAEYLNSLEILAVLVGALCHDLDHPGNNNQFEIASGSELANIYADDAVLERYHIYMTHKIMKVAESDILSGLTHTERTELRSTMTSGIMATDMSRHFALTEKLAQCSKSSPPFQVQEASSRSSLVGFIIHCADIGAQTQKKELALKWGTRVLEEFRLQAALETKLGIPTAPFMQGLDAELACMKLQQGFVAGIVIPLWTALSDCLPKLKPCLDRALLMKAHYEERVCDLSEKPFPSPRAGSGVVGGAPLSPRSNPSSSKSS